MFKYIVLIVLPVFVFSAGLFSYSGPKKSLEPLTFNKFTNQSFIRLGDSSYFSVDSISSVYKVDLKVREINGINPNEGFVYAIVFDQGAYTSTYYISISEFMRLKEFLHLP